MIDRINAEIKAVVNGMSDLDLETLKYVREWAKETEKKNLNILNEINKSLLNLSDVEICEKCGNNIMATIHHYLDSYYKDTISGVKKAFHGGEKW